MWTREFGALGGVSALSLGGGGVGQVWGPTTRAEAVATVREAVDAGITLLDMAPSYGNGEAETVIGVSFQGHLPEGVRITTKCRVAQTPAGEIANLLETSLTESLRRMRLARVDLLFLHNLVVSNDDANNERGTRESVLLSAVIPACERLMERGRIGGWGLTGIGIPSVLVGLLDGQKMVIFSNVAWARSFLDCQDSSLKFRPAIMPLRCRVTPLV